MRVIGQSRLTLVGRVDILSTHVLTDKNIEIQ